MKKLILGLVLGIALVTPSTESTYPSTLIVTNVIEGGRYEDDVITAETPTGISYTFEGDDLEVGDLVSVIMSDNSTPHDIKDDRIIAARYAGF